MPREAGTVAQDEFVGAQPGFGQEASQAPDRRLLRGNARFMQGHFAQQHFRVEILAVLVDDPDGLAQRKRRELCERASSFRRRYARPRAQAGQPVWQQVVGHGAALHLDPEIFERLLQGGGRVQGRVVSREFEGSPSRAAGDLAGQHDLTGLLSLADLQAARHGPAARGQRAIADRVVRKRRNDGNAGRPPHRSGRDAQCDQVVVEYQRAGRAAVAQQGVRVRPAPRVWLPDVAGIVAHHIACNALDPRVLDSLGQLSQRAQPVSGEVLALAIGQLPRGQVRVATADQAQVSVQQSALADAALAHHAGGEGVVASKPAQGHRGGEQLDVGSRDEKPVFSVPV